MEIIKEKQVSGRQKGQTMIEYILMLAVVFGVFVLASETLRKPLIGFLNTFSQGFQGVVRYGDRRIRADRPLENEHPGSPEKILPKHLGS